MKKMSDLEYLRLSKPRQFLHKLAVFFVGIPAWLWGLLKTIGGAIKTAVFAVGREFADIGSTFVKGKWQTKVSYFIMGFGNLTRGQPLRGILFLLFEGVFIAYMILCGGYWLGQFVTLGVVEPHDELDPIFDTYVTVPGDDSFKALLYGLLTIVIIVAFIYTWRLNVKQNQIIEKILASGKKVRSGKDDIRSLLDDQFHKTMLALPLLGIFAFTVLPIIFMILVAFTNYDGSHDGYNNLFDWVGLSNFNEMVSSSGGNLGFTFGEILSWTLIWAFFATFTNYFLGMLVAIMINKKGIYFKKLWRGGLVLTIAIPQFISLLYVSNMFSANGLVNGLLLNSGIIDATQIIRFWEDPLLARVMVILVNIWVGIPYLMLITTGILMNIPQDLYESAKIDGANVWQQYTKITLPYMLFVTGPYLLTSFISNLNNFNVIYLLTQGRPINPDLLTSGGSAGYTDLLITWLFKLTTGAEANYKLAAVIGILIFVVVAVISLIVYNLIPSTRNEEDFS